MLTTESSSPNTRAYFQETMCDLEQLRVIIWPRFAGKDSLIGAECHLLCEHPETHLLIVHPSPEEVQDFSRRWLQNCESSSFTNCTYQELPSLAESELNLAPGTQLYIYFNEPDYYHDQAAGDPYEVLVRAIGDLAAGSDVAIRQVTYIGTVTDTLYGSTLARICHAVEFTHTLHPRDLWPDWEERTRRLGRIFPRELMRQICYGQS